MSSYHSHTYQRGRIIVFSPIKPWAVASVVSGRCWLHCTRPTVSRGRPVFWFAVLVQLLLGVFRLSPLFIFACFWRNLLFFLSPITLLVITRVLRIVRQARVSSVSRRRTRCNRQVPQPTYANFDETWRLIAARASTTVYRLPTTGDENGWQGRW